MIIILVNVTIIFIKKGIINMTLDNSLRNFAETYDREAIQSIDEVSKRIGLVENKFTIDGFEMKESFDAFNRYLKAYAKFMEAASTKDSRESNLMEKTSKEEVTESFKKLIETKCFNESKLTYDQLPSFVESYLTGIQDLIKVVDESKEILEDADVDNETIGSINEYADMFADTVWNKLSPVMENILWASGYNGSHHKPTHQEEVVFA